MEKKDEKELDELIEGLVSVGLAAKRLTKKAIALKGGAGETAEGEEHGTDE